MNDHELDLALDAMGQQRTAVADAPELHDLVRSTTATAPQSRGFLPPFAWRFQSMFSATKFVAAAVIVALFGGLLLAGILTTPQPDETAPAAVTESPSPMTTEELLAGMVTEVVEPGVHKVINDGVRDMSDLFQLGQDHPSVVAGHDGSVWLHSGSGGEVLRLGDSPTYPLDESACDYGAERRSACTPVAGRWPFRLNPVDTVVAPNGTVWARLFDGTPGLYAFDGEAWTVMRPDKQFDTLAMGSDGRVWAVWQGTRVGRVDGEWEVVTTTPAGFAGETPDGNEYSMGGGLTVTEDGSIWLWPQNTWFWGWGDQTNVYRFDGESWESFDLPDGDTGHVVVGQDGTVWWSREEGEPGRDTRAIALHRFYGDEWRRFDAADEWPDLLHQWSPKRLEVAPDGRLWVLPAAPNGVLRGPVLFEGDEWTEYLPGYGVFASDMAPDGTVWLIAAEYHEGDSEEDLHRGLYVITPEAVAASE